VVREALESSFRLLQSRTIPSQLPYHTKVDSTVPFSRICFCYGGHLSIRLLSPLHCSYYTLFSSCVKQFLQSFLFPHYTIIIHRAERVSSKNPKKRGKIFSPPYIDIFRLLHTGTIMYHYKKGVPRHYATIHFLISFCASAYICSNCSGV
jgi:hypothetical protein